MLSKSVCFVLALLVLLVPASLADGHGMDHPTIAILQWSSDPFPHSEVMLNILQSNGFISAEERAVLDAEGVLDAGEHINIIRGSADSNFVDANLLVESALDAGADVLVTISAEMTQVAVNITSAMEEPVPVIFFNVFNPVEAGIAQSSCIKPAHVTGVEAWVSYETLMDVMMQLNPNLMSIGVVHFSNEPSGIYGLAKISELAEAKGIAVESSSAVGLADVRLAAESLASKGVEAIVVPSGTSLAISMPIITQIAIDNQIPMLNTNTTSVIYGATVSYGPYTNASQATHATQILMAWLRGEADIATTGIHTDTSNAAGVNLDSATAQGVEVFDELQEMAYMIVADGIPQMSEEYSEVMAGQSGAETGDGNLVSRQARENNDRAAGEGARDRQRAGHLDMLASPEQREIDRAFVAGLHCSAEMIAEQQAHLDSMMGG